MSDFGNNQQGGNVQGGQQGGEKADWLDKGIEAAGDKAGVNISQKNADTAGDFANKEVKQKEGFNLPGVN
ncbi:uncharacterized protein TRAVEDRAFT_50531 [Trametes versicolor FP-101664 SS1]|uniref:uncharacterized protein n=1 Tax=Trametes versicolor (strain FP-101664) TaxID=717944 RepID=UPI0004622730|nr:uncharacterized protein TRAVEDRAFT_50531 [Trametes versicolor FP-101664 SS1]EIW56041.1 hypothetical protein TRAVEDRAFT_50531 [Trametes versicolor FP-101664 SS1]